MQIPIPLPSSWASDPQLVDAHILLSWLGALTILGCGVVLVMRLKLLYATDDAMAQNHIWNVGMFVGAMATVCMFFGLYLFLAIAIVIGALVAVFIVSFLFLGLLLLFERET